MSHEVIRLSKREQVALMETLGVTLEHVATDSVAIVVDDTEPERVTLVRAGTLGSPRVQFDAIRTAVDAERELAELNAPPAYTAADHSNHAMCDPTLGCIEKEPNL